MSKLTQVLVSKPAVFDQLFKQVKTPKILAYFYGSIDEKTNKSWCPDCVESEPFIHKMLESLTDDKKSSLTVLNCPVERAEYKGKPEYPYRTHENIKLKSVPTVILYENGKQKAVDAHCTKESLIEFAKSF